jgi:hypothetical protein
MYFNFVALFYLKNLALVFFGPYYIESWRRHAIYPLVAVALGVEKRGTGPARPGQRQI